MARVHSRYRPLAPVPDGHVLRLGIDLGTGKIQIDGQHIRGTATRHEAAIMPIGLKGDQSARIVQIAILPEVGPVIYGTFEVEQAIIADPALQNRVLELWKLALHPEFQHLEEVAHVQETLYARTSAQIDRGAIQDFMEEQLRGIIKDIRDYYKSPYRNADQDASYWDRIPLELQISVPAMWRDHQRGFVCNAAVKALDDSSPNNKVELREEPLCVATIYMLDLVKNGSIREGQCLLIVDCGKGTLDIATVKLVRAPANGVLMQLQRIGPCSGSGAGSHIINTQAWEWLLSGECAEVPNLDDLCQQLNITRREFLRQFSKGIDGVKHETHNMAHNAFVTIRSSHGGAASGGIPRFIIELQPELVQTWYKTWTESATQLVKEHLDMQGTQQYRCASLTGGGCLATAFKAAMTSFLAQAPYNIIIGDPVPCLSPCSQGALLQHYFQEDELPPVASFYLARTEEFKRFVHKNATTQRSKYKSRTSVLPERIQRIMRYENGEFSDGARTPLRFLIEDDGIDDRIHVDVYYSEEDLEDHSALRDHGGALRPGIRSYPMISVDLEPLVENGFNAKEDGISKTRYFDVKTYVQMKGNEDRLELEIEVMRSYHHFLGDKHGQPYHKDDVLWTFTKRLWDKSMSHFVRDITGTAGPTGPPTAAAASAATPAVSSTPQNASTQGHRNTSGRVVRNRAINYVEVPEDHDMEDQDMEGY